MTDPKPDPKPDLALVLNWSDMYFDDEPQMPYWTQMPPAFPGECPFHRGQSIWDCCAADSDGYDRVCSACDGDGTIYGALCTNCKGKGEV